MCDNSIFKTHRKKAIEADAKRLAGSSGTHMRG